MAVDAGVIHKVPSTSSHTKILLSQSSVPPQLLVQHQHFVLQHVPWPFHATTCSDNTMAVEQLLVARRHCQL